MSIVSGAVSVLYACDANYAQHAAASIASLIRHNPSTEFEILVVTGGHETGLNQRFRRSFEHHAQARVRVEAFETPPGISFPLPYHLTIETYFRLWVADLFPQASRVLYLDPDTIVAASIDELWGADLNGLAVAAVPIPGSTRPDEHGMAAGSLFFNAGVMLFDLEAWRTRKYRDRCLAYLRQFPERAIDGDQDILNLCLVGDWLPLPLVWNVISPFYRCPAKLPLTESAVRCVCDGAKVIHFNGGSKPWSYFSDHPRKGDYIESVRETDWRDWRPTDQTALNIIRKAIRPMLPRPFKQAVKRVVRQSRQHRLRTSPIA